MQSGVMTVFSRQDKLKGGNRPKSVASSFFFKKVSPRRLYSTYHSSAISLFSSEES
jgi:hypothetical protein